MKKLLGVFILASVLLTLGFASAITAECTEQTIVTGTIYQDLITNPVGDATVDVTCGEQTLYDTSLANGVYSVIFDCNVCDYGDPVTVHAVKEDLTGNNEGEIDMTLQIPCGVELNVGVVNVPLVPEFGAIVGVLTVLGALGTFFVVRRR